DQHTGLVEGERDSATGRFLVFGETPAARIATASDLESKSMMTPYQHIGHLKFTSDNNFRLPKGRMNLMLGYQRNQRREFGDPAAPAVPGLYFDLHTASYSVQYHSPTSKSNWATSTGVNGMFQQNFNRGTEVLIPEYRQFDIGLFLYTRKTYKKYSFNGGLRADLRRLNSDELKEAGSTRFRAINKNYSNLSGSLGVSYEVNESLTLKLNLARGFRAPNIAELSSNGAHEGTNRYEYGQEDLSSETSMQADAGVELNTMHVSFSGALFYNNIQHYIFYRKLLSQAGGDSVVPVNGENNIAYLFDQSAAALYGLELGLDLHPHPLDWLHLESDFSYVRGKFYSAVEGDRDLPFMPAARWNTELRTDFREAGKRLRNLYLRLQVQHVFAQNAVFSGYDTETATPGYTILNMGAGIEVIQKRSTLFSLHVAIENLTDLAYQHHLSRLKYTAVNNITGRQGVFNAGRNFSVKVNVPLNWKLK
ncbi:MAG TPA: TonB-dependent receptor, partial [Chitinophagaceae bacterium]